MGFDHSDDAAVYRLSDDIACISTVDFITPPVDDPLWFGRIAAANSLSDVYAMGGRPVSALNLVMFPSDVLGNDVLKEILRGGLQKVQEAGAVLAGGHSIEDAEPKYGLSVTGVVHPERILKNQGVRPSDVIILTKPIGSGVLFNARRSGRLPEAAMAELLPKIAQLNRTAIETALRFDVHACTDVTGFGVLGHMMEMVQGTSVGLRLEFAAIPQYANAIKMYEAGEMTLSNVKNHLLGKDDISFETRLSYAQSELLVDPQTSGGLLIAVSAETADELIRNLHEAGVTDAAIVAEARTIGAQERHITVV